ncbi:MAG: hypothetical protein M8840_01120 [marine benthic group bacterium]|nr:hypothetical protein [Gemmatimonadota bacterium]MCL7989707.1 hypothetical protein [Gemmatimonadota bacterium]
MSSSENRFTEAELREILRAASGPDRALPPALRPGGFTVEEIESVAREAGLDSGAIAAAAARVAVRRETKLHGAPGVTDLSRRVRGSVSSGDFGELAETIAEAAGEPGVRSAAFGGLEWETKPGGSRMKVTVTPGEDSTSVRVHTDASAVKGLCYVASMGSALALGGIAGAITEPTAVLTGVTLMAGAASAGAFTGWAAWRAQARRLQERSARVFAAVTGRTAELAERRPEGDRPGRQEDQESR